MRLRLFRGVWSRPGFLWCLRPTPSTTKPAYEVESTKTKLIQMKQTNENDNNQQPVDGDCVIERSAGTLRIEQVAAGLNNVEQFAKKPCQARLEVDWNSETGLVTTFYFGSTNKSAVSAMNVLTQTSVDFNNDFDVWETKNYG